MGDSSAVAAESRIGPPEVGVPSQLRRMLGLEGVEPLQSRVVRAVEAQLVAPGARDDADENTTWALSEVASRTRIRW